MTKHELNDPTRCPACGLSNQCTLANPLTATHPCWCFSVTISQPMLTSQSATNNPETCLCPDCAQARPRDVPDAT